MPKSFGSTCDGDANGRSSKSALLVYLFRFSEYYIIAVSVKLLGQGSSSWFLLVGLIRVHHSCPRSRQNMSHIFSNGPAFEVYNRIYHFHCTPWIFLTRMHHSRSQVSNSLLRWMCAHVLPYQRSIWTFCSKARWDTCSRWCVVLASRAEERC